MYEEKGMKNFKALVLVVGVLVFGSVVSWARCSELDCRNLELIIDYHFTSGHYGVAEALVGVYDSCGC